MIAPISSRILIEAGPNLADDKPLSFTIRIKKDLHAPGAAEALTKISDAVMAFEAGLPVIFEDCTKEGKVTKTSNPKQVVALLQETAMRVHGGYHNKVDRVFWSFFTWSTTKRIDVLYNKIVPQTHMSKAMTKTLGQEEGRYADLLWSFITHDVDDCRRDFLQMGCLFYTRPWWKFWVPKNVDYEASVRAFTQLPASQVDRFLQNHRKNRHLAFYLHSARSI